MPVLTMGTPPISISANLGSGDRPSPLGTALPRRGRRRSDDDGGFESDRGWHLGARLDLAQQHLGAQPTGLEELLADGRETDVIGRLDVVVADDREVGGNIELEVP